LLVFSNRVTSELRKDFAQFNIAFLRKPAVPDQIVAGLQMVLSAAKAAA
jgi:hypothetical protein